MAKKKLQSLVEFVDEVIDSIWLLPRDKTSPKYLRLRVKLIGCLDKWVKRQAKSRMLSGNLRQQAQMHLRDEAGWCRLELPAAPAPAEEAARVARKGRKTAI